MLKRMYNYLNWVPEFYFILVSILWYYLSYNYSDVFTSRNVNFMAVILIVIFHIQLFLNNQVLGKVLAAVVTLTSVYLSINLFLSVSDSFYSPETQLFTLKAGNLILLNLIMAFLLYNKYRKYNLLTKTGE